MNSSKKNVRLAVFIAFAMVLSIVEWIIPLNFVMPGIKLGLANIIIIVAIFHFSLKDVLIIVIIRAVLTAIISANLVMLLFSLAGGIFSTFIMYALLRWFGRFFSIIGASISGAFFHNMGQMLVAIFFIGDSSVLLLLPIIGFASIISGTIIGIISCKFYENINQAHLN